MLNLVIVEDELIVRKCLVETIDWQSLDIQIAGEAANITDALALCREVKPDIILADIIMDSENSLDMIEQLRKDKNDAEIIILSGYDNFNFAKRALENNVSAYLLKPARNETIIKEVLKAKDKILEKDKLNKIYMEHVQKNCSLFLSRLISEKELDREKCDALAREFDILIPSDIYCVALLRPDYNTKSGEASRHTDFEILRDTLKYCISTSVFPSFFCETDSTEMLMVTFLDRYSSKDETDRFFEAIREQYNNVSGNTITIGRSGIFKNISIIRRAALQAEKALMRRSNLGRNRIILYTEQSNTTDIFAPLSTAQIDAVVSDIKKLKANNASHIILSWLDEAANHPNVDISMIKNTLLELVILILRHTIQNNMSMNHVFGRELVPAIELQKIEFIPELKEWISDIISCIEKHPEICLPYTYSPLVQKAILYIQGNYPSNINTETLAAKLYVSPRTLTRTFKKETGKTFREYLTDYRINAAVELLKSDTYKIFEVSAMVGYHDPKSFHKVFKRITGHSPGYYKKSSD